MASDLIGLRVNWRNEHLENAHNWITVGMKKDVWHALTFWRNLKLVTEATILFKWKELRLKGWNAPAQSSCVNQAALHALMGSSCISKTSKVLPMTWVASRTLASVCLLMTDSFFPFCPSIMLLSFCHFREPFRLICNLFLLCLEFFFPQPPFNDPSQPFTYFLPIIHAHLLSICIYHRRCLFIL